MPSVCSSPTTQTTSERWSARFDPDLSVAPVRGRLPARSVGPGRDGLDDLGAVLGVAEAQAVADH